MTMEEVRSLFLKAHKPKTKKQNKQTYSDRNVSGHRVRL